MGQRKMSPRQQGQGEGVNWTLPPVSSFEDVGRGSRAKECGQTQEAGKHQEMGFPLELLEAAQPAHSWTYGPLRHVHDFQATKA